MYADPYQPMSLRESKRLVITGIAGTRMVLSYYGLSETSVLASASRTTYESDQEHGDVDGAHNDC
jgi:hypothetical protein